MCKLKVCFPGLHLRLTKLSLRVLGQESSCLALQVILFEPRSDNKGVRCLSQSEPTFSWGEAPVVSSGVEVWVEGIIRGN